VQNKQKDDNDIFDDYVARKYRKY